MAEENNELNLETLSEDCVFEIFDRLPTNYLYVIARTCTRFFDLAAIQYRRKHPGKYVCVTMIDDKIVLQPDEDDVKYFGRKFLNMVIRGEGRNFRFEEKLLQFIPWHCSSNLQMVRLEEAMLQGPQLKPLKDMLGRVETLVLHKCGMNDDLNDCLLSECHRLKHLIISDSYTVIDPAGSKWMQMKYPLLESVQICSITLLPFQREQWEQFFRQNPQIKHFSCDHWFAVDKDDRPVKTIRSFAPNLTRFYLSLRGIGHLNSTYYDLSILCKCSQFQRLELQFTGQAGIQYLCRHSKQMLATFEQLHALHFTDVFLTKEIAAEIAWLQNIKQLNFVNASFGTEFAESLSKNLHCLEEIYSNSVNDFTPFIRIAPKLKKIEFSDTEIGNLHLGWGLHWLNDERTKVAGACPITIYVKNTAMNGAELAVISSGIITIKPIIQDKHILTRVQNTFVN